MENILFILAFIGALILFFCVASFVGHFMKLDDYMRDHQNDYPKKTQRYIPEESRKLQR